MPTPKTFPLYAKYRYGGLVGNNAAAVYSVSVRVTSFIFFCQDIRIAKESVDYL